MIPKDIFIENLSSSKKTLRILAIVLFGKCGETSHLAQKHVA